MKLIIVVRYDVDDTEPHAIAHRVRELHERLAGYGPGLAWVATGEPCERVTAAVEAEQDPPPIHPTRRDLNQLEGPYRARPGTI